MKTHLLILAIFGFTNMSLAEETIGEKAESTAKTAHRSMKKGMHRTAESICGKLTGDNKTQCMAKEAKNRINEGKDAVVDKATEVKNAVDKD